MRVWNSYTPCQCIRHLTKRWIKIDSKTIQWPKDDCLTIQSSESDGKETVFIFRPRTRFRFFGDSLTNDVDDVIGFLNRTEKMRRKKKESIHWFFYMMSCFSFRFVSRRVSFRFLFSSISMGIFPDYSRASSIFMICLFVVIWLTWIFVTPFSTSNYYSAVLIHLTIVICHIRLIQWAEMFIVQFFKKIRKKRKWITENLIVLKAIREFKMLLKRRLRQFNRRTIWCQVGITWELRRGRCVL